jgi:trans-2,3-dihydro-3-hydroxyanthranilate isomerase
VRLAENVGPIPVRFSGEGLFGEMTQRDPEFGVELGAAEVARLTGLAEGDLDADLPPQVVSTGAPFAVVALRGLEALARLRVRHEEATPWLHAHGARWFYALAPTGGQTPAWRARMQFNGTEDPATGSAAGCAIGYLVSRGAVAPGERIHVRQGEEVKRPSDLYLSARFKNESTQAPSDTLTDVRVAGSTVLVANGQLFLP